MKHTLLINIVLGIFVVLFMFAMIWIRKFKLRRDPNYRASFILGLAWLPLGLISGITVLWLAGITFLIIGIAYHRKWDKYPQWKELSSKEKNIKITFVLVTILLVALLLTAKVLILPL